MGVPSEELALYGDAYHLTCVTDPPQLIDQAEQAGCFIVVQGRVYFQDQGLDSNAALNAEQLRILADELDNRNGVDALG